MGYGMRRYPNKNYKKNVRPKQWQGQPQNCNVPPTVMPGCPQEQTGLPLFFEMIAGGRENANAALELLNGAIGDTQCVINNLKEGKAFRLCAIGDMQAALAYLEQLSSNSCGCINPPQCQCLQQDMAKAFREGAAFEDEALCLLEQALGKLNQAQGCYQCGQGLSQRWLNCLCHSGNRSTEEVEEEAE